MLRVSEPEVAGTVLDFVTPVILTLDEAPNIARTLEQLRWAEEVIVLDSGSTDATRDLAMAFPNVRFFERPFDTHAQQWNHALSLARTPWVLSLDADYQVPQTLVAELATLDPHAERVYCARFRYLVHGKPVRGAILPPRAVLFRTDQARYIDDGHTQLLEHAVPATLLQAAIDHDDRKPLARWLRSQIRYAELEADKLQHTATKALGWPDRIRRWVVVAPVLVFIHVYVLRGALFSGWRGWLYAAQRALAELMLALYLAERRLAPRLDR